MRTLRTLLLASLLIVGSLLVVSATDPPHGPDDAFMCFKASISRGAPAFIKPAPFTVIAGVFQGDETAISKPVNLCVPVERDGRPPVDRTTSLLSYSFRLSGVRQTTIRNVPVLDSFGPRWLDLSKFELYAAPSLTNASPNPSPTPSTPPYFNDNVDRFVCAKAKQNKGAGPFPKTYTTTITDELTHQTRVMALKKPSRLCFPANARGQGMKNPRGALMCYQAGPASGQPELVKRQNIQIFNEFPSIRLDTKSDGELCVPAQASIGPIAVLQAAPTAGAAPLLVSFSGLESVAPLGETIQYAWSLGDGGTSNAAVFTHTYSAPGVYHVTLNEDTGDGFGGSDEVTIEVTAAPTPSPSLSPTPNPSPSPSVTATATPAATPVPTNRPPLASFSVQPPTGNRPLQVVVDASGSSDPDGFIASYAWAFGDGQNDTGATTSHTFSATGTFSITLTVTDNSGATAATSHDVVVTLPPNEPPTASLSATPTT